jgi:hypothetical protein
MMTPEEIQVHLDACHCHAIMLFDALVPNAHATGHPGVAGPSSDPNEPWDQRVAVLDAVVFTLGKVRGAIALPPRDLRRRSAEQRRLLSRQRLEFIRAHPEMSDDQLLDEMYARGWYSRTTYRMDAWHSLARMRECLCTAANAEKSSRDTAS